MVHQCTGQFIESTIVKCLETKALPIFNIHAILHLTSLFIYKTYAEKAENCQIIPWNHQAPTEPRKLQDLHLITVIFKISKHSINTMVFKLTSSPSWLCVFKLGYQEQQKHHSQQLWLSGLQRECQQQFLTLGCSWLIFYLFDFRLNLLHHIFDISKHTFNQNASIIRFRAPLENVPF